MVKNRNTTGSTSFVLRIKSKLSLRETARIVGHNLPNRDGIKFCSPLRPDKNPSCTITGEIMRDWSRDKSYDAIAYFAEAKGITNGEAIKQLAEHLGITTGRRSTEARQQTPPPDIAPLVSFDGREPTGVDFAAILRTRKLPTEAEGGLVLAHTIGILRFAKVGGFDCWLVTDESRRVAEARRLDGEPFPAVGPLAERKAHTLKGSRKDWPCGLAIGRTQEQVRDTPLVIVEGAPDLLCAYALLAALPMNCRDVQAVTLLGASQNISDEALHVIRGREVIIISHGDNAGRAAADRWGRQLSEAACQVTTRELPPGKDLNDLVSENGLTEVREVIL